MCLRIQANLQWCPPPWVMGRARRPVAAALLELPAAATPPAGAAAATPAAATHLQLLLKQQPLQWLLRHQRPHSVCACDSLCGW
jgi:hypothetical protein